MNSNLFRQEVIDSKQTRWTGNIILSRPFSFTFLTICALFVGLIIMIFAIWGSYTKRSTVQGQLIPQSGLIQVYADRQGNIIKKNVYEGKSVKKGDVLFVISTTTYNENGDIITALSKQIKLKEQSIKDEIIRMHQLHNNEREAIVNQINLTKTTINQIDILLLNQKNKVTLAKINQDRYEKAFKQNAASTEEFENKKTELLNQIANYESLQREKNTLTKNLTEQKIQLNGLQDKQNNEMEQLNRLLSSNYQELIEMQSKQSITIQAHTSGIVSTVNVDVGQFVDISKPLITILPKNTLLIAQLYVPSQAIGFIKEGDSVLLRYKAYPYQKFGHSKAKVLSVAKTAWASQDLKTIGTISGEQQLNNEPVYVVRVLPNKQTIRAYGQDMPLHVGMTLEGDILHETRKLYEWAFEPLFSITGKL